MFIVLIRTIFLYFLVILVMRLMGKRQIGELQPYEFVITIMISDLAALPMQDTRLPLILGIIPILTLLFIKTILTQLQLKSQLARKILEGEPSVLICKGKINFEALKKQQINLDELMEELRLAGYFDLNEIQYAILENNGQMSFLTYDESSSTENSTPNTGTSKINKQDSKGKNKATQPENKPILPVIYVLDGEINKNILTASDKDKAWIEKKLKKYGANSMDEALLFMKDTAGKFICQLYDEYEERCKK